MAWAGLRKCDAIGRVRVRPGRVWTTRRKQLLAEGGLVQSGMRKAPNEWSRWWWRRVVRGERGRDCVKGAV